mgnify:CR=1 FL=1
MQDFKSWEEMSVLEQYACQYWDMYKDAYGIRPRHIDTSGWSDKALVMELDYLAEVIQREEEAREVRQNKAIEEVERIILDLRRCGARDRQMAIRWLHEAHFTNGDAEYLAYCLDVPYGYFRK